MADTITLAIDALASAAFIEGGVSIERTDEARQYTEQRKRELLEAIATSQSQAVAAHAPAAVALPEITDAKAMSRALRHCEQMLMKYEINRVDHEAIQDEALAIIRAALAATPALPATEDGSAGDLENKVKNFMALVYDWSEKDLVAAEARLDPWTENDPSVPLGLVERLDEEANAARKSIETKLIEILQSTPSQAAPQAQPADALDAKRWRAAAHDLSLKNLALVSVDDYGACEMLTGDEANEAIDAAMAAAQEGGRA
ncbi:hypothetical protein [Comamonas sp.]|uniref:hypothetical protein n=1 Tax=Comamonas sp. TaxID=34028 RepID=UPI0028A19645|nr:hypothetical protein [Comamonas sp.]